MLAGPASNPFYNKTIRFSHWILQDLTSLQVYHSDTTTIYPYESLFIDLGIALTINQVPYPGDSISSSGVAPNNGLLWAPPAFYQDSTKIWLAGVPDDDIPQIRLTGSDPAPISAPMHLMQNTATTIWVHHIHVDPNKNFGKIQTLTVPYTINGVPGKFNRCYLGPLRTVCRT